MAACINSALLLCFTLTWCWGLIQCAGNESIEQALITRIMTNYKKEVRPPVLPPNRPNVIKEKLSIYQILELDNRKQTITVSGGLAQIWNDSRLVWDPLTNGKIRYMAVPGEMLWRPNVGLFSSVNDLFDVSENSKNKAILIRNGLIWWNVIKVFTSTCNLNMKYFPFDWQYCQLTFSASTGFTQLMVFRTDGTVNLEFYTHNAEWDLVDARGHVTVIPVWSLAKGSFLPNMSTYTVSLTLQRRHQYYWIHLIIPCMFISTLVMLVFVMPAEAGEKISFSVTILLAFTVYQLLIADSLPKGSESVSLMSAYLTGLVALSALSVVFSILVLNVHHRNPKTPLPWFWRRLVIGFIGRLVCKKAEAQKIQKKNQVRSLKKIQVKAWTAEKDSQDKIAIVGNPHRFTKDDMRNMNAPGNGESQMRAGGDEAEVEEINEWKLAAEIMDRFFLISYIIVTFIINLVILFILPAWAKLQIDETIIAKN